MAVIVREERIIGGKRFRNIKVYRSDKFAVTEETRKQAEKLDEFLSIKLAEIRKEVKSKDLLKLKGKSGALDLWYFIGEKLRFVDDPKIVPPEDKKYIWRALWDHAGDIAPGELNSRSGTHRDHFLYCYKIAQFDKNAAKRGGNWRAWVEFFDSPKIHSDERILYWIAEKMKTVSRKNWVRILNRGIRRALKDKDTSFYTKSELYGILEKVWKDLEKSDAK
jgi:hypothetical protein